LPPISITEDEANALILSEKLIQNQGDTSLIADFNSLVIKIKSTLRNFQKEKTEILENRIQPSTKKEKPKSDLLRNIQKAITNKTLLKITYHSLYRNEQTDRKIEPLAIYFTENAWVIVAFCHLRKGLREFRVDRIQSFIALNEKFTQNTDFNLDNYFNEIKKHS
jgi:predicted DNA-binding transcriptional regulator YafY